MKLKRNSFTFGLGMLIALIIACNNFAVAQSTIFNIPSTDAVGKGKTYFEFDFLSHLESHDNGGFQTYAPRIVYGLGKGVEAGVNIGVTHSAAPTAVFIQPNLKWQFYANEKSGTAVTVGAIAYAPVKNRDSYETFGLFYGNASKKFSGSHGPRVTVGAYGVGGGSFTDNAGAIVGYEQPLTGKVSFVADWFSGNNFFGYVTPGFSFSLPKNSLFNIGYSIGNYGKKNNALFMYYGITF